MATDVKLPRLGQGMESGTIVKWLKAEGDAVEKGEPLFEVDTDKATQEVEAEASGVLLRISVPSGEVPVGETVALIGEPGEAAEPAISAEPEMASEEPEPVQEPTSLPANEFRSVINGAREQAGGRVKASPLARKMAQERGIDLGGLTGTGPDGRIIAEDVERGAAKAPAEAAAAPAAPAPAAPAPAAPAPAQHLPDEVESVPLTSIRRTIARRLTEAAQVPVFQLTVSMEMTHANALVERSRELNPGIRVTVTDLLTRVCASALQRHPDVNVQFSEEALLRFPSANIGIAVAAPQGLVVPVVRSVERLSLAEVAERRAELVERARGGSLQLADLEGGTFTISNLGMFGVEQFTAILNPPQAAILAVGATADRAVVVGGEVVVRPMMTVTATFDHRAVDGAPAADFLRTVKTFLEDPALAL
ncbi:MAG TPA: dihydrolipoamide acetyltransferase family protein [Gaiellaceae bacterium]|jgi:pyruvate dehydrogenase E2 component (dihydrolipoamide acetyltransferase)|nr:dihydrolipoamide acetyltransferase family protein [Gaiellaceae bacterium]